MRPRLATAYIFGWALILAALIVTAQYRSGESAPAFLVINAAFRDFLAVTLLVWIAFTIPSALAAILAYLIGWLLGNDDLRLTK